MWAAEEDNPAAAATEASPNTVATPKAEKKKKQKKVQPPQEPVVMDVSKLDIRVGLIEKCWEHEEADKLYCEEINLGEEEGPRNIASGLKAHYSADEMVGKKVLVLANLKSRKLVGFPSHGMVLCACKYGEAEDGSEDTVEFVCPPEDAEIGDRVVCEGFEGEPATENQVVKKKILNAVFPDLKVNADGVAVYKDVPLTTTTGGLTCKTNSLKDVPIS
jgi:methionine--tRNA ligase beta chain